MTSLPQQLIDALTAELTRVFGPIGYSVEAREPIEGELKANAVSKDAGGNVIPTRQIFITTESISPGPNIADQGMSTASVIPVLIGLVMQRPNVRRADGTLDIPGTITLQAKTLRRRLTLVQAVQRVMREFGMQHSDVEDLSFIQEQPVLMEGFLVSVVGIELTFYLGSEEAL